jgi:tetratricopeptide (TPR) repeat protein
MEVGHYEAAEAAYQRMIDLSPNLASYSRGSWLRWLIGDVDGALDLGRRAVEAGSPRVPEELAWTIVQLGNLHAARGDADEALRNFDAALRVFPNYPAALDARGALRRARGDAAAAVADARAAAQGSSTTEHLLHLGEALEDAGQRAEADEVYAQAERAGRRSDPRALALFYANHDRDHEAAVALARREIAARPEDVYAQDVLAWTLARAGQTDEAARLIDRARRMGTREARFAFHAAVIARAKGDAAAARTLACEALAMNPRFDPRGVAEARALVGERACAPADAGAAVR